MAVLFCWERGRFLTSVASVQDHVVVSVHALRGERRTNGKRAAGRTEISIHAPREGSDLFLPNGKRRSPPPAERVTGLQDEFSTLHLVSQFTTERR